MLDRDQRLDAAAKGTAVSDSSWDRLAIVGSTGAGKSTLARKLADRLSSKHVELDALHFEPGWKPRPLEEFRDAIAREVAAERWIADGNWRPTRDLIWSRATAIVWLDYSMLTCFGRAFRRSVRRAWTDQPVCGNNRETFRMTFASRESVLLWLLRTHRSRRQESLRDLADPKWAELHRVRLRGPAETEAWLATVTRR